jgi:hypothetical protein
LIVGDIENKNSGHTGHINYVEINPRFIGQKRCVPLLQAALQNLFDRYPDIKQVTIENESDTEGGIPACFCYYKVGKNLKLRVLDSEHRELASTICTTSPKQHLIYTR